MEVLHKQVKSERGLGLLRKLRQSVEAFPEVVEKVDEFGHTSFRIKDKPFIIVGEGRAGFTISFKAGREMQELLLQQHPYYKTPYIGQHGWVSLSLVEEVPWEELEALFEEAYLRTAPKRLTAAWLEERRGMQAKSD